MKKESKPNCSCLSIILIFNLLFGGWSVDYLLNNVFNRNIPFIGDIVIGFFTAQITVPCAIIAWVLKACGVDIMLVH